MTNRIKAVLSIIASAFGFALMALLVRLCDEYGAEIADIIAYGEAGDLARTVSIVTGVAAYPMVSDLAGKLSAIYSGLKINVYEIKNHFFGESITVSGLLTGKDIFEQLSGRELGDELLIPKNALRHGEDVFLCDMTVSELSHRLGVKISAVGSDGYELVRAIIADGDV